MKRNALVLFVALLGASPAPQGTMGHDMMMRHGTQVMPFDQKTSMHVFAPDERGGIVMVMVKSHDPKQVVLVRSHLQNETSKFAGGNYGDPAYVHGHDMPGLREMAAGASRIVVTYAEVPYGAEMTFRTTDAALVGAIHRWLAAQNGDHNVGTRPHCDLM